MNGFATTKTIFIGLTLFGTVIGSGWTNEIAVWEQSPAVQKDPSNYALTDPIQALDLRSPLRFKPLFGFEVGMISLSRSAPDSFDLVSDQNATTLLNMNQMKGSAGAGLDAKIHFYNLFRELPLDAEVRFFQVGDMTYRETFTAQQVIPVFFGGSPVSPSSSEEIFYQSRIRSVESNIVARTPYRIRFLAGFRFLELDEDFRSTDNNASKLFRSRTRNNMFGGQVGAEAVLMSNSFGRILGSFKWAALDTDAKGNAVAENVSTLLDGSTTSQLLDFELTGAISLTRSFSMYAGYQGLAASDVGLVLTQSRISDIFLPMNPITFESAQWHGLKLGLMGTF